MKNQIDDDLERAIRDYIEFCEGPANWPHWGALVTVLDWEAVWLSLGLDPKEASKVHIEASLGAQGPAADLHAAMFFSRNADSLETAFNHVENEREARFRAVRNWIESNTLWSRLMQSANPEFSTPEVHELRLAEFATQCVRVGWRIPQELRALASPNVSSGVGPWPWGTYETELLRHLRAAAEKYWKLYDPSDPTTAPRSEQVFEYLVGRGVPNRVAEIMAQLLRADGLRPGPRPGGNPKKARTTRR